MGLMMRKVLTAAAVFTAVSVGVAGASHAGEIKGNGERKDVNGKSICAYSGQNDEYHEEGAAYPRVQSFGQIVREVGPIGGVPGEACNPSGQ